MHLWIWLASLAGILGTAVVLGTDMFFLTVGRPALRSASPQAGTQVMGFFHLYADARMPTWGVLAIVSNLALSVLSKGREREIYLGSALLLILFVILYNLLSKPINKIQTAAAKTGAVLDNARELQAAWDRVLWMRVPLLALSLLAQSIVLLIARSR